MRKHIVIPDCQVKPGVAIDHIRWIGKYIKDKEPDVVVNLGDFADMESLCSYDKGKKAFEGRRYKADIKAAQKANEVLWSPLFNSKHWNKCETHMVKGNHENRITRLTEDVAELDGILSEEDLDYENWYDYVHDFLVPVEIDGITYSHYFYNPLTGRALGGVVTTRLKNIGFSFTMGHQQGMQYTNRALANGTTQHGLIAGSCYLHEETYIGPQAQNHWKGIVVKHEVSNGDYDAMFVSLDYLCRHYEKMEIKDFLKKKYGRVDGYV